MIALAIQRAWYREELRQALASPYFAHLDFPPGGWRRGRRRSTSARPTSPRRIVEVAGWQAPAGLPLLPRYQGRRPPTCAPDREIRAACASAAPGDRPRATDPTWRTTWTRAPPCSGACASRWGRPGHPRQAPATGAGRGPSPAPPLLAAGHHRHHPAGAVRADRHHLGMRCWWCGRRQRQDLHTPCTACPSWATPTSPPGASPAAASSSAPTASSCSTSRPSSLAWACATRSQRRRRLGPGPPLPPRPLPRLVTPHLRGPLPRGPARPTSAPTLSSARSASHHSDRSRPRLVQAPTQHRPFPLPEKKVRPRPRQPAQDLLPHGPPPAALREWRRRRIDIPPEGWPVRQTVEERPFQRRLSADGARQAHGRFLGRTLALHRACSAGPSRGLLSGATRPARRPVGQRPRPGPAAGPGSRRLQQPHGGKGGCGSACGRQDRPAGHRAPDGCTESPGASRRARPWAGGPPTALAAGTLTPAHAKSAARRPRGDAGAWWIAHWPAIDPRQDYAALLADRPAADWARRDGGSVRPRRGRPPSGGSAAAGQGHSGHDRPGRPSHPPLPDVLSPGPTQSGGPHASRGRSTRPRTSLPSTCSACATWSSAPASPSWGSGPASTPTGA